MHIIQVSPLIESVPPSLYGGTERMVSYLTEGLVENGYTVTLFASGDSKTSAHLISTVPHSLRQSQKTIDSTSYHVHLIEQVYRFAASVVDPVIHFHIDYLHFPVSRRMGLPQFTTMHGRLDLPDTAPVYAEFQDMPLVSISNAQRWPLPSANWIETVYHGLPTQLYQQGNGSGGYIAFLGRISPEKRVDRAVEISQRSGLPLKIAAKVDPSEIAYFEQCLQPLLGTPNVEFIGEIGETEKQSFLGNAKALIFPIDWPEPFGLVMIEAMACGTPVIAFGCGSVPEVIKDGVNGRIVSNVDEAVNALATIDEIDRSQCRREFERKFTLDRMIAEYSWLYKQYSSGAKISA